MFLILAVFIKGCFRFSLARLQFLVGLGALKPVLFVPCCIECNLRPLNHIRSNFRVKKLTIKAY